MRVLIACEFSGIVRDAFASRGHDAWSCDFLATEMPGNHIQGNVLEHLDEGWDLMIAHPPCTYLSNMGNCRIKEPGRLDKREKALHFFRQLAESDIPKIAIENPRGYPERAYRKASQIIQPYEFGEPASKATCLWLKNLPPLFVKFTFTPFIRKFDGHRFRTWTDLQPGWGAVGSKNRSVTFQGIANAMAEQWG